MTEETSQESSASSALPNIENLADSNDAKVIEARAHFLKAQATLAKANQPLFDKIVLRGLIPVVLALVTPWALWTFSEAKEEQTKQGAVITKLEKLLFDAKVRDSNQQEQSAQWRARMGEIEAARAAELKSMADMVNRLDSTMKTALVYMAVARLLAENPQSSLPSFQPRILPATPSRQEVMSNVAAQIQIPGTKPDEIKDLAGEAYDRLMEKN